ncbi:MAG TPA: hypothetical protein PKA37_16805, partial [Planctomycetota bacterium]|nr:hypothetical protein [Planctomycetota bacterium]
MAWRVSEIRLAPDREADLLRQALRLSGLREEDVLEWHLVRRSLDRRRGQVSFLYTVDLVPRTDLKGRPSGRGVAWVEPHIWQPPLGLGQEPLAAPPVIIGTGPAGLFAGLLLAQRGFCPVLLERGDKMNERARRIREINEDGLLDPESNYLYGEGGAGTYSDGKLTSRSK